MPQIFGGSLSPRLDLMMQLDTKTVVPNAVLNTYGVAQLLKSPRIDGGIVPLLIRARGVGLFVGNVTLRITPTWSDGSVGVGVLWTPFAAADDHFTADMLVVPFNGAPHVGAPGIDDISMSTDFTLTLAALWKQGVSLQQLAFDCASDQNAETATIEVIYRGLYT